jgi:hypothetical protein
MGVIQLPESGKKLVPGERIGIDGMELPEFRNLLNRQRRTDKNILIRSPFALGDCICAEPAIRFALKHFEGCTVSLRTPFPELFRHIPNIKKIFNSKEIPDWDLYSVYDCYHPADALHGQFVHNFNMSIEDYIAVCLFKGMIPVADRNIVLKPTDIEARSIPKQSVVIHAGKHWVAKTFPKKWWDLVIHHLLAAGIKPTLIGAKVEDGKRGYVDVDPTHCFDLRDKLTIMQSVAVVQNADVVLTNDSAPYHMAASGTAEIGVFSTVRHFDFIGHWRRVFDYPKADETFVTSQNQWNWKTTNLAKGQMWQEHDVSPAINGRKYDVIDHGTLMSWLPDPAEVCGWVLSKLQRNN